MVNASVFLMIAYHMYVQLKHENNYSSLVLASITDSSSGQIVVKFPISTQANGN